MQKQCKQCFVEFEITQDDLNFYNKVSPVFEWKKYQIPAPTNCPNCRQQRRLSFRNERKLYKRKCDLTWKTIVSIHSSDKPHKVYEQTEWWSDKWDCSNYWIDFDFNKTFFEQFSYLELQVPKISLNTASNENSEYSNYAAYCKNCYMTLWWIEHCEDVFYWRKVLKCKSCADIANSTSCELCYEVVDSEDCYKLFYSQNCQNCSDSYFLIDCIWCMNCFWCTNLISKQYYIFNKEYSKEDYFNAIKKYDLSNYKFVNTLKNKINNISKGNIKKYYHWKSADNCTWDYIINCTNCINTFDTGKSENLKYCIDWYDSKDCYDCSVYWSFDTVLSYECESYTGQYNSFVSKVWFSDNILYCINCVNCSYCFWCTSMHNKKCCILNKQYTKEEYNQLVPKIIEHMKSTWEWWEFFPIELSPFAYNETIAQEYFTVTKEECLNTYSKWLFDNNINSWKRLIAPIRKGWKWKDQEDHMPDMEKTIPANKLPDKIKDVPDDILNWAIKCEVSQRPFKIISQELEFYREHNIPVPHLHPDERHKARMKLRNPRKLFDRKCMKCEKDIQTTYSPDREEIVYCKECYLGEVY